MRPAVDARRFDSAAVRFHGCGFDPALRIPFAGHFRKAKTTMKFTIEYCVM